MSRRHRSLDPAGTGYAGDAAPRKGSQLWHCLRHFGIFSGGGYRCHTGRGQGIYSELSRKVSRRARLYARYCGTGKTHWLCDHTHGTAQISAGAENTNFNIRSGAERIALNTPIQGTAADIIKVAMVRVHRVLAEQKLQASWCCKSTTN